MNRMTLACVAGAGFCIVAAVTSHNGGWLAGVPVLAVWDGLWQRYVVRQNRERGQR